MHKIIYAAVAVLVLVAGSAAWAYSTSKGGCCPLGACSVQPTTQPVAKTDAKTGCCGQGFDCCYAGSPCCETGSCCGLGLDCCFPGSPCCESDCCTVPVSKKGSCCTK